MYIDIDHGHLPKRGQIVCGDVFLSTKQKNENRLTAVLSDGLGSGIKANIMAKLAATMAMKFILNDQPFERSATSIRETLPIDSTRKIAYATFTIIDTEFDGFTRIIEYGNPQFMIFRKGKFIQTRCDKIPEDELYTADFQAELEDRIILFSDGVSQSGIGRKDMPFGWGISKMAIFIENVLKKRPTISAADLHNYIIQHASYNDDLKPQDDISCAVLYFRKPRCLLLCSGPPYDNNKDATIIEKVKNFKGHKVISGGTTAQIIARGLRKEIEVDIKNIHPGLPPIAYIDGFELVTEGILTLGKTAELLKTNVLPKISPENPAKQLCDIFMNHDKITFFVGTRINEAHQDPNMPVELEIRRNVIKKIAYFLEKNFLKETEIIYI